MRLLTYNIRLAIESDLSAVAATIHAAEPDVVGLQELGRDWVMGAAGDQLAALAGATGLQHAAWGEALHLPAAPAVAEVDRSGLPEATLAFLTRPGPRVRAPAEGGSGFGVGLLSRWPLSGQRTIGLHRGHDERRVLLVATVLTPRGPLSVAVTHLSVDARDRARQAEEVGAQLAALAPPVVLLGDLNDSPGSPTLSTLAASGLLDAASVCPAPARAPTFPARLALQRLDYVLVSGGLHPLDGAVGSSRASDHRPLWIEVRQGEVTPGAVS